MKVNVTARLFTWVMKSGGRGVVAGNQMWVTLHYCITPRLCIFGLYGSLQMLLLLFCPIKGCDINLLYTLVQF